MSAIVIDANSLIIRNIMACALDDLKAGKQFTGGVFATVTSLGAMLQVHRKATKIVAFFDNGVPAFRRQLIPGYKENRVAKRALMSDEDHERMMSQLVLCADVMRTMGITCLSYKDREADDGVAAACRVLKDTHKVVVVSGDRDLWQLIDDRVSIHYLKDSTIVNADNFEERVGIPRQFYLIFRTLMGDSADNIKGAYGCGDKRAIELIKESITKYDGYDRPPTLDMFIDYLASKEGKRKKYEQNIIDDRARLEKVYRGIDLSRSFGGTKSLQAAIDTPLAPDRKEFIKLSKKLKFVSILANDARYWEPFTQLHQRAIAGV